MSLASVPNYDFTKKALRCAHCGNKTLMKIIADGTYVKELDNPEYQEQICYNLQIIVCKNCDDINVIQQSKWSEDEPEYVGVDSSGQEIFITPTPPIKYLHPLEKEIANGRCRYSVDLALNG